ncbi:hypothetical protein [Kineococcus auxinigenes]|uniref:hypothetical protein n=1 Tax=unclassified Kineococcus TaxID=2621656 RepID=UPI003D7CE589
MKKSIAAGCAVAAAALITAVAPAAAQHPGENGAKAYTWGITYEAPCGGGDWSGLDGAEHISGFSFSPTGRYMTFTTSERLFVVNVDECLPPRDIGTQSYRNAWSPDGKQLAVDSPSLRILDPRTGEEIRRLLPLWELGGDPAWSRDGRTIAYSSREGIRTVASDGSADRLLVPGAWNPEYSPDGRHLAYVKDGRITIAGTDGAHPRRTALATDDFTWSPDGKSFFLTSAIDGDCVTATTGGRITSRTGVPFDPEHPDPHMQTCGDMAWQPRP